MSLRFLAITLLDVNIQAETHDSIEDAKTVTFFIFKKHYLNNTSFFFWFFFTPNQALMLYYRYLELKEPSDSFEDLLRLLYEVGQAIEWKVEQYKGTVKQLIDNKLNDMLTLTSAEKSAT